jgi:hypothetical protein
LAVPETLVLADGLAGADDDAGADDAGADDDAAGAEDDGADEEDDELLDELHAAAANPRNAMPSRAVTRLPDDRYVSMISTIATGSCGTQ